MPADEKLEVTTPSNFLKIDATLLVHTYQEICSSRFCIVAAAPRVLKDCATQLCAPFAVGGINQFVQKNTFTSLKRRQGFVRPTASLNQTFPLFSQYTT